MRQSYEACQKRPCDPRTMAEAIDCGVNHSKLEVETTAARIGKRAKYLYAAANAQNDDLKFQAELLLPLMLVTGNLAPLHFLCRELGGVFVPLPPVPTSTRELFATLVECSAELGGTSQEVVSALGDQAITHDELPRIFTRLDKFIAAGVALRAQLESSAGRGRLA